LGAFGGLFGVTVGGIILLIHLSGIESLGVPYLSPFSKGIIPNILRKRMAVQKLRPKIFGAKDRRRQK
jgi:hypothetical protein